MNCSLFVFFALPCCWQDAWNAIPLERHPFIVKHWKWYDVCKVVMVEMERHLKVKRMTTSQETRYRVGVPGCLGPMRAWTLVIEMIAKPALPIWFSKIAWQATCKLMFNCWDQRLTRRWSDCSLQSRNNQCEDIKRSASWAVVDAKQMRVKVITQWCRAYIDVLAL